MASEEFRERLQAVRESDLEAPLKRDGVYRNGQVLASSDDVSAWDNFDRYFKFYNISVDEPPPIR
jgi:hypothetical protein